MKSIFVGNLSFSATDAELRTLFENHGAVTRVTLMMDRETGRSRGFAFVEMANDEEALAAIAALNGSSLGARTLNVNEARPRGERPAGGPGRPPGRPPGGGHGRGGG
ncbi:MAG: RNA recognition motif domain-containing protein, partial [Terriglobales bacterium]